MSIRTNLLPLIANIVYRVATADSYGGERITTAVRRNGYRCRIYQSREEIPFRNVSGEYAHSTHKLIGEPYELHTGDILTADGQDYEILGPDYPACVVYSQSTAHHNELFLRALG
jgi:hypothetical protein